MKRLLFVCSLLAAAATEARTNYVDAVNGSDSNNGQSWATAYKTLAYACHETKTADGDTIMVAPGVYNEGYGNDNHWWGRARVHILRKLHIVAAEGPSQTIIEGSRTASSVTGNGVDSLRIFIFQNESAAKSVVEGFTLRNGTTHL